jgi:hypothetical protein
VCVSPPMGELIVDVSSELAHKLLPEDAAPLGRALDSQSVYAVAVQLRFGRGLKRTGS